MKIRNLLAFTLLLFLCACATDDGVGNGIKEETIKGRVQKGPFISGTEVVISDLTSDLEQTGVTYTTTVLDNSGRFEHSNFQLSSTYVELTATGFYFNEVANALSLSQLTLKALTDVSGSDSVNVNLLTHMQRARIDYLVKNTGISFDSAKVRSYKDVMQVFGLQPGITSTSQVLDISMAGEENAKLLAISVLMQGYRTTAEMAELLANIVSDIREDGVLTNSALGSALMDDARLISLEDVRTNLENRYEALGITAVVPDFEHYVNEFIAHSGYTPVKHITYPNTTSFGDNLLSESVTEIETMTEYPLSALIPRGMSLKVVLRGGLWYYNSDHEGITNCHVSDYDFQNHQQTLTSTASDVTFGMIMQDFSAGTLYIDIYENKATVPTRTKTITVLGDPNDPGLPNDSSSLIHRRY